MTPADITTFLKDRFGPDLQLDTADAWQVDRPEFRLLVLLSADQRDLRVLVPIAPAQEVQPFLTQLLAANFEDTGEGRYALHQDVLWSVFHHDLASLQLPTLEAAIARLLTLKQQGVEPFFETMLEAQMRQIIFTSKRQGQSLETTLQTLDRFYSEGVMGDLSQGSQYQTKVLGAWRQQLERLWPEVEG
ncbi:MAG: type III secretion system chaperone [Cyanobacteria bacterium]|nr:type III secretion system chaperone [Cyanobacteriota bacterium]